MLQTGLKHMEKGEEDMSHHVNIAVLLSQFQEFLNGMSTVLKEQLIAISLEPQHNHAWAPAGSSLPSFKIQECLTQTGELCFRDGRVLSLTIALYFATRTMEFPVILMINRRY